MAPPAKGSRPGRALAAFLALIALTFVLIPVIAPDRLGGENVSLREKFTPRLGLDLEGGTSIILQPRPTAAGKVTDATIAQAVEIIRQRVDSFGVAESEVAAQGSGANQTITVSVPGKGNKEILDRVRQTAELQFRQVLEIGPGTPLPPPTASPTPGATTSPKPRPKGTVKAGTPGATPEPAQTTDSRAVPPALVAAPTTTPKSKPQSTPEPTPAKAPGPTAEAQATSPPSQAGDIPAQVRAAFDRLDCSEDEARRGGQDDDPGKVIVSCDRDGAAKYILAKAELVGTDVKSATAGIGQTQQGVSTGEWQVNLTFTGEGKRKFADITGRVTSLPPPQNAVAIVLDGGVVSAPTINEAIPGGEAQITGNFSQAQAQDLQRVLQFGALPLSFTPGSVEEVSAAIGGDQLSAGLVAGALGLGLVVVYTLVYYRGLGLVSIFSLLVAAVLTYATVTLLGWWIGFRLSLAGVAGLIVAIGITADSFIVYFERLRDEVRDGRTLRTAVEVGWTRARRTILAADFVSLLAAVVLYILSVGNVRGFAFTLGLTTLIDIVVVFLFTKPLVTLLSRTRFFSSGHPMSGLDPRRLGGQAPAPVARPAMATRGLTTPGEA
ncbi:MAG: protein translocase subunit SecD [Actinomycetota bacterium]|nr:protein translocase subunit SecD [Actinomycetota bacterium]